MLDKILVPLDGSPLSDRILIHVRRLLHAVDAEVTLLRVIDEAAQANEARDHLDAILDSFVGEGARTTTRIVVGEAAARILDVAAEIEPSLIAMATRGRTGVARAVLGSTCATVRQRSRWPLLLANPSALEGADSIRFRKILVPLDGTEASAEAVPAAVELACLNGAELVFFAVESDAHSIEESFLRHQQDRAGGLPVTVRFEYGDAVERILDATDEVPIDLVVMAARGRSTLNRWLFGSVSDQIIPRCRCPVLIASTGAAAHSLTRSPS